MVFANDFKEKNDSEILNRAVSSRGPDDEKAFTRYLKQ